MLFCSLVSTPSYLTMQFPALPHLPISGDRHDSFSLSAL